jgi:serine/threonine protein kinase
MTDRIGQQLGNYRLARLLGRGGFAEVYLAEHIVLGTKVAIKLLHTRVAEADVTQFQREARLLAGLRHPQIVRVFDFGVDGEIPYLVMDYAPSGTLRTLHTRGAPLPITTVVDYIKQVAQALQYAHDRKVVHRDVKPENMLIGEYNEILLSDFGIALIAQSSHYQSTKDMAGTIAYMAPEQIAAHPRPASDQYSLGIVAYEWLCGALPFHGSLAEIAIKHSVTQPPSLCEQSPELPAGVEQVIGIALAKKPEERFASVNAFANALAQACQVTQLTEQSRPISISLPVTSPPLSPSDTAKQPPTVATPLIALPDDTPTESPVMPGIQLDQPIVVSPPPIEAPPDPQLAKTVEEVPDLTTPVKTNDKSAVSRRAVIIGAASIASIVAAGTGTYLFLHRQSSSPQIRSLIYSGHSDAVWSVAWSPDGKVIASGSDDNTVQIWNTSDGSNVLTYRGHSSPVNTIAWSPDGKRIASGSGGWIVQVWNANDGSKVLTYRGHTSGVLSVVWSPDGKWVASGSHDKMVRVCQVASS